MRSILQATSSRIAVLACGLTLFAAACGGGGGGGTGGKGGATTDGGAGGKVDAGSGGKMDGGGTGGATGAGGKMDAGGDTVTGTGGTGTGGSGAGGTAGGTGGVMLSLPWHAYLPLNAPAPGNNATTGTVLDLTANHYDGTYFGTTITFSNSAINLTGSSLEFVAVSPKGGVPAVDVTGSYSVSVWVTLTNTGGFRTVVGGEGTTISSFFLQKRADLNAWAFTTPASDATNAAACIVPPLPVGDAGEPAGQNPVTPQPNVQYHLVATVDATAGLHILYVNGVESGRGSCPGVGWADTGVLGIGHGIFNGRTDNVQGSIAEVGVINSALTAAQVAALYARGRIGMPPPDAGVDATIDAPADVPADVPSDTGTTTDTAPADTGTPDAGIPDAAGDGG